MFFSVTTNLIMTVPVLMPLVNQMGINGIQFGVVCVLGLTIGCITPPVGAPMYLACQFANVTIGEFFKANKWYYASLLLSLLLIILFPQISLFLPSLMLRR
jgi:TRAP-type C4-dicarboxylate transport system permease large subunit